MKKIFIIIGKQKKQHVDFDLTPFSEEIQLKKVSRKQAKIFFNSKENAFFITNLGRNEIRVNDTYLETNKSVVLNKGNNNTIEIAKYKFIFKILK